MQGAKLVSPREEAIEQFVVPSFVSAIDAPGAFGTYFDFWTPKPIGHEPTDYARGVQFAREAMVVANFYRNEAAIQFPLMEMVTRGSLTALERGFIQRIAEAARCGIQN
jgi:hypothetical protein